LPITDTLEPGPDEASGAGIVNGPAAGIILPAGRPHIRLARAATGGTVASPAASDDEFFHALLQSLGFELVTACDGNSIADLFRGISSGGDILRLRYHSDPTADPLQAAFNFDASSVGGLGAAGLKGSLIGSFLPLFDLDFGFDANGFFLGSDTTLNAKITGTASASGSLAGFNAHRHRLHRKLDPSLAALTPTDANGDGKIRLDEFLAIPRTSVTPTPLGQPRPCRSRLSSDLLDSPRRLAPSRAIQTNNTISRRRPIPVRGVHNTLAALHRAPGGFS